MNRILIGLRIHRAQSTQNPTELIRALIECFENLPSSPEPTPEKSNAANLEWISAVAYDGSDVDLGAALQNEFRQKYPNVILIPVPIWIGFTPALNALLSCAFQRQCRQVVLKLNASNVS